jgi:hypothetical protein
MSNISNFDDDCNCRIKIRTQEKFIEQFNFESNQWEQFYPDFRVYQSDNKFITLYAKDTKKITFETGCQIEIDGLVFTDYSEVFEQFSLFVINFNCACGSSGGVLTASNGLSLDTPDDNDVILGGELDRDTIVDGISAHEISLNNMTNINLDTTGAGAINLQSKFVVQDANGYYYWGNPTINGTIRIGSINGELSTQKLISGLWVTLGTQQKISVFKDEIVFRDTFMFNSLLGWATSTASGGTISAFNASELNVLGVATLATGANVNARAGFSNKGNSFYSFLDGNKLIFKTKMKFDNVGGYFMKFGFISAINNVLGANELCFVYDPDSISRTNPNPLGNTLLIVSRAFNSDAVVHDTSIIVNSTEWKRFAISIDTETKTANFYVNESLVHSIVWNNIAGVGTNLPIVGTGTESMTGAMIQNSISGSKSIKFDFIEIYKDFN